MPYFLMTVFISRRKPCRWESSQLYRKKGSWREYVAFSYRFGVKLNDPIPRTEGFR